MSGPELPGSIADIVGAGTRLLFVGINPGLRSAQLGQHFAGRSNRFWPALAASGLVPVGFGCQDQGRLPEFRLGITNLVARPTARADQLDATELRAGAARLVAQLDEWRGTYDIRVCAMLGITAYRVAFRCPNAIVGARHASSRPRWWILHNPSGLNAHARLPDHVAGLKAAAADAELLPRGA